MAEEEKEEVCRALAKYGDRLIESILRATEAERWHLMPELLTNLSAALTLDKQLKCPHSSGQQEELCEQLKRASLSGMKEQECVDPEFLDYMKSHVREARRDVDKQNWDKAAWRTRVVQGGMLDTAFIYLIEHCAKERE